MVHLKVLPCLLGIGALFVALSLFPVVAMADVTFTTEVIDKDVTDNSTPPHVIGHISSSVRHKYKLISVSSLPCCTSAPDPNANPPQLGDQSVVSTDSYGVVSTEVEVRTQNFDFDEDLASRFKLLTGSGDKKSWQKSLFKSTSTLTNLSNTLHCGERYELWKDEQTFTQTETEIAANKKVGIRTCTTMWVSTADIGCKTNDRWDPSTEKIIDGIPCTICIGCNAPEPKPASETPK